MMLIGFCMPLVLSQSVRTKLPYPFLLDAFPLEKKFLGKFEYSMTRSKASSLSLSLSPDEDFAYMFVFKLACSLITFNLYFL